MSLEALTEASLVPQTEIPPFITCGYLSMGLYFIGRKIIDVSPMKTLTVGVMPFCVGQLARDYKDSGDFDFRNILGMTFGVMLAYAIDKNNPKKK